MHPAGSAGKMVLSSGAVFARPRLPALTPLDPEPRYGGGQVKKALWIGPGIIPNKCHPGLFTKYKGLSIGLSIGLTRAMVLL